jgi:hypothetical protein
MELAARPNYLKNAVVAKEFAVFLRKVVAR